MVFHKLRWNISSSNVAFVTEKQSTDPEVHLLLLSVQSYLSTYSLTLLISDTNQILLMVHQVLNTIGSYISKTISASSPSSTLYKQNPLLKLQWKYQNGLVLLDYLLLFKQTMKRSSKVFWSCSCYCIGLRLSMRDLELLGLRGW